MGDVLDNFAGDDEIEKACPCRVQLDQIPGQELYPITILEIADCLLQMIFTKVVSCHGAVV